MVGSFPSNALALALFAAAGQGKCAWEYIMKKVSLGLDVFVEEYCRRLKGRRLGLLSNQASLDRNLRPAKLAIAEALPGQLKALFGPQHGHAGAEQDNMIETGHSELDRRVHEPSVVRRQAIVDMNGRVGGAGLKVDDDLQHLRCGRSRRWFARVTVPIAVLVLHLLLQSFEMALAFAPTLFAH